MKNMYCLHAYVKCSCSHAQNTLQPCCQLVKLRIMTIIIKLVLIKFGTSDICIDLRATYEMCTFAVNVCLYEMLFLTNSEQTSTMSPVNETQDYDY